MSDSSSGRRPLEGIRVVDCSRVLSGPICGRMLSDMGADVIKIEAPEADILRSTPPIIGGFATMFSQYNVGKRNVSIDLKEPEGAALLARLAAEADVFVENFRPGVLARLGLDPAALRSKHPRLIVCSITGWGQTGPWSDRPAYAPMVQAEAGTLAMGGALRQGPMRGETMQHADLYAGMMASQGILAALFHRERTGEGQHIDVSMGEALVYVNEHASAEVGGYAGSNGFETWNFESFELANGRFVHVMGRPDMIFPILAERIPIPGALEDSRFATPESRFENRQLILECLVSALREVADQPTLEKLLAGSPAVVIGVRTTLELADTEWARHRGLMTEVAPGLRVPTAPWRSSSLEIGPAEPAIAKRGQHNASVLEQWLGMTQAEVSELEDRAVLQFAAEEPPSLAESPQRRAFRDPEPET